MKPTKRTATFPEPILHIRSREDLVVESLGYDLRSQYVETYWLPILGPSAILLLRRLSFKFETESPGYTVDMASLSLELGLGTRGGKHSPLWRSVDRICRFDAATRNGNILAVRKSLAAIQTRHIKRLPAELQNRHNVEHTNLNTPRPPNRRPLVR